MRLYLGEPEPLIEDDVERQRIRESNTVTFVDSIECASERRQFWKEVVQKKAVEQGLASDNLRESEAMQRAIKERERLRAEAEVERKSAKSAAQKEACSGGGIQELKKVSLAEAQAKPGKRALAETSRPASHRQKDGTDLTTKTTQVGDSRGKTKCFSAGGGGDRPGPRCVG